MARSPLQERRSAVGLDGCGCCLALASGPLGCSGPLSALLPLREQLARESLGAAAELRRLMRQGCLEPVVRDPRHLLSRGIGTRSIDQTLLSILLFFHRYARSMLQGHEGERAASSEEIQLSSDPPARSSAPGFIDCTIKLGCIQPPLLGLLGRVSLSSARSLALHQARAEASVSEA